MDKKKLLCDKKNLSWYLGDIRILAIVIKKNAYVVTDIANVIWNYWIKKIGSLNEVIYHGKNLKYFDDMWR